MKGVDQKTENEIKVKIALTGLLVAGIWAIIVLLLVKAHEQELENRGKITSHSPIIPDTLLVTDGKRIDTLFIYKQPANANERERSSTQG